MCVLCRIRVCYITRRVCQYREYDRIKPENSAEMLRALCPTPMLSVFMCAAGLMLQLCH